MKRNQSAYKPGPSLLDLIEHAEAISECQDDIAWERREAWAAARNAEPSYREQYQ